MATTRLGENEVHTVGDLPEVGATVPAETLTGADLRDVDVPDQGRVVLNVFPSIDTGVCAASVRRFNELAAGLGDTSVFCVSMDLPFALRRFCGAEGIENVTAASAFRSTFGSDYGLTMADGGMRGLLARSVFVLQDGVVRYVQLVPSIGQEPDYDAAVAAVESLT
jgi:thiol peroxidase